MPEEVVALLFVPPWDPIRLRADRAIVIGRNPACDLPIPSANISRKHAWVHWEGHDFVVQDLGSTNGTFVNDQRVHGARPLNSGDRIRVGDHVVTFCTTDGSLGLPSELPNEGNTAVFSPEDMLVTSPTNLDATSLDRPPEALTGRLADIPAFAVLQLLELGGKTGRLDVKHGLGTGAVWFECGKPVHARTASLFGVDAFTAITQIVEGRFDFHPGDVAPQVSLELSMAELLIEASRRRDEVGAGVRRPDDDILNAHEMDEFAPAVSDEI